MIPNVSIIHLIHLHVCMGEREREQKKNKKGERYYKRA